jgi:hypothetical protein
MIPVKTILLLLAFAVSAIGAEWFAPVEKQRPFPIGTFYYGRNFPDAVATVYANGSVTVVSSEGKLRFTKSSTPEWLRERILGANAAWKKASPGASAR